MNPRSPVPVLPAIAALVVAACSTTPTSSFYALGQTAPAVAGEPAGFSLSLGPIDLPEYLERPQIVTRAGDNRLRVDEFNRWGGPLDQEVDRVLSQQVGQRLGTRVYSYPSRVVSDVDYRIAIDFRRFDGELGGEVALDAAWSVIDDRSGRVVATRQAAYSQAAAGTDYAAYASALSGLLTRLAEDVEDSVRGLGTGTAARP